MAKMIFINLPVAEVARSTAFYEAIGAKRDMRFCTDDTSMVVFSESITFMLMTHARFHDFTPKAVPDLRSSAQVLIALSEDSRADVDATADKAIAAGAKPDPTPTQEYGDWMYGRSFEDPDGHIIELAWMDVDKAMAAWSESAEAPAA